MISNFYKKCRIPPSGPGALPHLKVRRVYSKWGFYLAPRCAALFIHTPTVCMIERRGAERGKLFGAGAFGVGSSTRLRRRALFAPPPQSPNKCKKKEISLFSQKISNSRKNAGFLRIWREKRLFNISTKRTVVCKKSRLGF